MLPVTQHCGVGGDNRKEKLLSFFTKFSYIYIYIYFYFPPFLFLIFCIEERAQYVMSENAVGYEDKHTKRHLEKAMPT
jgi:hypothetical protein